MPRRTQTYRIMPWTGGINTSDDPGVLNPQELVQADNVVFSTSGARIKREALEYLEQGVPPPDFKSSSGTIRTLKWTTNALVNITSLNERLVQGEKINITGESNYNATSATVNGPTAIQEVTDVTPVADVSGSLAGKYFLINAGDEGTGYYVWFQVSGVGTDPAVASRTGVQVDIATDDTAGTIASAIQTAVDALADFSATVLGGVVTITAATGGLTSDASAGTSGFTVSVVTQGGHSITYTASTSYSESETAAGALAITRASKIVSVTDYWRFTTNETSDQIFVFATDDFQLFSLDDAGRRVQIHGQEQVSKVVCAAASTLTTGDYFLLNSANNENKYYVWYNVDSGGGDPAISGRSGIEVAVTSADTDAQVATATSNAIGLVPPFDTSASTNEVTITNEEAGLTDRTVDSSTGFTITTVSYGATLPTSTLSTIRTLVYNERLIMFFSGLGNYPIKYNPDESAKYQLLTDNINGAEIMPDPSFAFIHQGRIWCNDKSNRDRIHYSETFDETLWLGFGDSGALDINPGDGDPEGITCGYVYKGFAVIGKKMSRYRVLGDAPEIYFVEKISDGLGCEGPLYVPIDERDVIFVSKKGFHSQAATDAYGDTDAAYLSADIKGSFNDFEASKIKYIQGAYVPELNSVAFAVQEDGEQSPNDVWLYNPEVMVPGKERAGVWYRWPNISCTSLTRRYIDGKYRLVFGTSDGRLIQAQKPNDFADFGETGINFVIKTGTIYPGNDPHSIKAFKKISMIYRPKGNFAFNVKGEIDNQDAQSWSFNQISGLDLLGETFVMGNSLLGSSNTLAPFTYTMEGYGRGITLTISQPSADEQVEIWGFIIEYENADLQQSTDEA